MTEIIDDKLIQFKSIQDKYIKNIKNLNIDTQKKFFKYKEKPLEVIISSYDDMYDILYLKNKLSYLNIKNLDKQIKYTNNICSDVFNLLKTINYNYFDDINFKKVATYDEKNRFNPKENEIIYFNCLRRDIFQQNKFKSDIFLFENKLKELNIYYYKECSITFYEDDDLKMIWFIITISNKN